MSENIEIKIQDKVDSSVSSKLKAIAADARTADSSIKMLQASLQSVSASSGLTKLQNELSKTAISQQRLATATARTATTQAQAQTATQRLATEQQRTAAATDRASIAALRLQQAQDRQAGSSRNATTALSGYIRAAAGIAGVTLSAAAITGAADAYTTLQNKLQNVTTSYSQVTLLTEELFNLANKTRAGVEETATAFTRFDRSLRVLGKSQEDTLRLTETVNKALVISGTTAQEAQSALLQLSQGFNAGRLQGDEFRAVSENIPIVLDAVAKALGVPINQVKKLSTEGKITSEVLFKAFSLIQKSVDETFAKTTPTIGQSLVVLKNNALQFFGELNKATGFSVGLSNAILILANNMKVLAAIALALGAAMLVSFGPAIYGAIVAATGAVKTFTLALASNPIGLIAVALATVIGYLTLFRNEIKLGTDEVTTLGDLFKAAFSEIGQAINSVISIAKQLWASVFGTAETTLSKTSKAMDSATSSWSDSYTSFFKTTETGWAKALINTAKVLDAIAGFVTGLAIFAGRSMAQLVLSVQEGIPAAYNAVVDFIEKSTNRAIEAGNKLRALFGMEAAELVNFERMGTTGADKFEGFGKLWANSLEDGFKSQGGAMQGVVDGLLTKAAQIGKNRASTGTTKLRGSGKSQIGADVDEKAAKAAERRATAMEKINTQLDNEISRMFQLSPQREAQAKFDQIEESLIQKRIHLTDSEAASIKAKIKAVQDATEVQKQFDAIYSEATQPLKDYNATQEAANKLLAMGAISQEQYSRSILKSKEAYANSQDLMRQYNKDLQQQFDLLKLLPKQREIEQQIMQVQNEMLAKGVVLSEQELKQLREKLTLLQQLNAVAQQEASLLSGSVDRRQTEIDQLTAINKLLADRNSGFTKSDALSAISGTEAGRYLTGSPEMQNAELDRLNEVYAQIDAYRQADLISEQTASAAKMQIWAQQQSIQLSGAKTFFSSLEGLQNSNNSKMARIGKAAAIANAIVNTYESATGAYAAMASIPMVGPALGAAAAAAAIAAGMANVAQIRSQQTGFMSGGYTGNGGTSEVAGVVHGREFVMNAAATSRVGVANMQALQSGAASVQRNGENVGNSGMQEPAAAPQVNVNTPVTAVVVQSKESALAALKSSEGKAFIIEAIEENGGTVARIVGVK